MNWGRRRTGGTGGAAWGGEERRLGADRGAEEEGCQQQRRCFHLVLEKEDFLFSIKERRGSAVLGKSGDRAEGEFQYHHLSWIFLFSVHCDLVNDFLSFISAYI